MSEAVADTIANPSHLLAVFGFRSGQCREARALQLNCFFTPTEGGDFSALASSQTLMT